MFVYEDGTGLPNANSLASVQDFKDYYSLRNVDISTLTDTQIEGFLVLGTDYIVQKYDFKGSKLKDTQSLPFPRVVNNETIFPTNVKYATILLAFKSQNGSLLADSQQQVKKEKVDVLEVEYMDGSSSEVVYNDVLGYLKPYLSNAGNVYNISRT